MFSCVVKHIGAWITSESSKSLYITVVLQFFGAVRHLSVLIWCVLFHYSNKV